MAQEYYWQKKTRRNLIIKARQKGISKIIDADQLIDCVRKPINAVIISHEREATTRLFNSVRGFIETAKNKPVTSIDSQHDISFPKVGSYFFIGTAGQKAFGRGDTIHRAHLSEAAYYPNFERILTGVAEAAELGQIDIETTPNGRNEVYDLWQKAKAGKSSFTPIFIPWFIDGEYSVENLTEKERKGLSVAVQELISIPDAEFKLNQEEQTLRERVRREWNMELTIGQMKWRRYKLWDKGQMFFQEYPEDDVSCFLQSGRTVFSSIITNDQLQVPLDDLTAWAATDEQKAAFKKRRFYAGVDGAEGTPTGDAHCFAVIDVQEGRSVVIYDYSSNEPIDIFWQHIAPILEAYDIVLGIEKNGIGLAHTRKADEMGISFDSWDTTAQSRPVMITDLEEAYRKAELIETYTEAENQLRDMEYSESNRPEHKNGKHDDRVFARAIALQMVKRPQGTFEWL